VPSSLLRVANSFDLRSTSVNIFRRVSLLLKSFEAINEPVHTRSTALVVNKGRNETAPPAKRRKFRIESAPRTRVRGASEIVAKPLDETGASCGAGRISVRTQWGSGWPEL
jgi:hypothetical protein